MGLVKTALIGSAAYMIVKKVVDGKSDHHRDNQQSDYQQRSYQQREHHQQCQCPECATFSHYQNVQRQDYQHQTAPPQYQQYPPQQQYAPRGAAYQDRQVSQSKEKQTW